MQFLALLAIAFVSFGCQATGQTAGELLMPDELHVFGSAGDGNLDGNWYGYHTRQFDGDLDTHTLGVSLGWNLTAVDVHAQRETARAVRELAARLNGAQLARASSDPELALSLDRFANAKPEKCGVPPQQEDAEQATLAPDVEGSQGEEPADLEGVLYAVAALATAIAGYLGRNKIPGVKALRGRRAARAQKPAGDDPPLGV